MHTIRVGHQSLKWSAHPAVVAAYLLRLVTLEQLDLLTCTEGKGRAKAVRKALGSDFRVISGGEFLIIYRRAALSRWLQWPLGRLRTVKGADWSNGPHAGTRRFQVLFANLRPHGVRRRLRVMVTHAPSHVQTGLVWRDLPDRVRPYRRGIAQLGEWIARPEDDVLQLVCMDSNLEQHHAKWRVFLENNLDHLMSVWHEDQPRAGTEGARLIDTAHTNAEVSGQRIVHDSDELDRPHIIDHKAIVFDVDVP